MRMSVCAVLDTVVKAFLPPIFGRSLGECVRSFTEAANAAEHQFKKHATDYVLFELGTWDDGSGIFTCTEPRRVLSAMEAVRGDSSSVEPSSA